MWFSSLGTWSLSRKEDCSDLKGERVGTGIRAPLLIGLTVFALFSVVSPAILVSAQERSPAPAKPPPAPPTEAPTAPTKPEEKPPEEVEKAPPPAPVTLPGAPVPADVLDLQAPGPTTPPPAPGLIDRFQRRLDLIQPGQILFDLMVEEAYDSNAFDTSTDPKADFVTVIVPGLAIELAEGKTSLSLRYTPEILLYSQFPELNRVDHALRFAASWDPTPGLRLFLRDSLLITDNTPEQASPLGIGQAGLQRTTQNNLSPGVEVRLGPQDTLLAEYENIIIDEAQGDDSRINGGRVGWRHDLPRGGFNVTYDVAYVDREIEGNSFAHAGTLRASYRLNPRDELLLGVGGSFVDNQVSEDTAILGGDVGLNHEFSPQLRIRVTGGAQVFGLEQGNPQPAFSTNSDLEWTFPNGSLTLGFVQGYENTFATVDDVGVVLNTSGFGSFSYQLGPRLSLSVSGSYGRVEFQEQDETDLVGRATIDVRFQLWQSLFLTAGYTFFDRNSNVADEDLTDHRVFIGLSMALSGRLPF